MIYSTGFNNVEQANKKRQTEESFLFPTNNCLPFCISTQAAGFGISKEYNCLWEVSKSAS